jgi:hypothetical protein
MNNTTVYTLDDLLSRSHAADSFKTAVRHYEAGHSSPLIGADRWQPPVKVLRVICKLLETYPDLAIERIDLAAAAGCSDYTGVLDVQPDGLRIRFDWNCEWKARQLGWVNFFKMPDQIRAANEMGYQCFREFREIVNE